MTRIVDSRMKFLLWSLVLHATVARAAQKFRTDSSPARTQATAKHLYEQYTLGQIEEGAKIIYTYQATQAFDEAQQEISLDFHYPQLIAGTEEDDIADGNSEAITQLQLYVKAVDGSATQAYVTGGGIGEQNISLQVVASNASLLNYMLVIYGKAA